MDRCSLEQEWNIILLQKTLFAATRSDKCKYFVIDIMYFFNVYLSAKKTSSTLSSLDFWKINVIQAFKPNYCKNKIQPSFDFSRMRDNFFHLHCFCTHFSALFPFVFVDHRFCRQRKQWHSRRCKGVVASASTWQSPQEWCARPERRRLRVYRMNETKGLMHFYLD